MQSKYLIAFALLFSCLLARLYAGGWNDGSRLATVESLVERHTFAIDDSIYVDPEKGVHPPYAVTDLLSMSAGTKDKLFIDGHFYSDKTPVPAILMAGVYQAARWFGMPSAAESPGVFAWVLTVIFSGGVFLAALLGLNAIVRRFDLPKQTQLLVLGAFTFATFAATYVEHVNNHILLLGTAMPLFALLLADKWTAWRTLAIGALTGFSYTIDLGVGPPMMALLGAHLFFLAWTGERYAIRIRRSLWVAAGALPFLVLHHVVNYQIAGTFGPANANPAFFNWPGCPFNEQNMTGGWKHASIGKALLYAADLMVGKKGYLLHNLPLLALIVLPWVWRRSTDSVAKRTLAFGLVWTMATWLIYAASSNNLSGMACSIRWFVPLLAPGFVGLAFVLKEMPGMRRDVLLLSAFGTLLCIGMIPAGPWTQRMVPMYWPIVGMALVGWGVMRFKLMRRPRQATAQTPLLRAA